MNYSHTLLIREITEVQTVKWCMKENPFNIEQEPLQIASWVMSIPVLVMELVCIYGVPLVNFGYTNVNH